MRLKKMAALGAVIILLMAGCSVGASSGSGGLVITEVVTSNSNSLIDPVLGKPDWVELCNTGSSPLSLLDYSISESNTSIYDFPDVTLGAGEYIVIYCCPALEGLDSKAYCTNFKLSKGGTALTLSHNNSLVQMLEVPALETDISYGLSGEGGYAYFALPTPGAANTTEAYEDLASLESDKTVPLVINEVLPKNNADTESCAWAEIYNAGSASVKLSDYYITEDLSDPTKARLPDITIGAGEYAIVRFSGNAGADEVPFRIGDDETMLAVSNNFGSIVDTLSWSAAVLPGISAGPGEGGGAVYYVAPTPGADNGSGHLASVELSEGTGDVRINEILLDNAYSIIDQDGERSEWVELYNASGNAVRLTGCALSDREDNPLKWRLPDIELAPGSYLIVFLSGKDSVSESELHANFSLGSADEKLLLTDLNKGTIQTITLPRERKENVSLGLSADGQWLYYYQPTPAASNDTKGFAEIAMIDAQPSGIRINEVASVSAAKSGKQDWIELYNGLSEEVNLSGYSLSDTRDDLKKWPLDGLKIASGGYQVVDGYQNGDATGELGISLTGEKLYLVSPEGYIVDQFGSLVLRPGISCGLGADNTTAIFQNQTRGAQNDSGVLQGYCGAPDFSEGGGYKMGSVSLTMSTKTPGGVIYYTTDGSTPTSGSAQYSAPVTISGTTTVRAITVAPGMLPSDETVATYLFEDPHSLPVVCLSMTRSDLDYVFGGIERDSRRERAGHVEYYEADGKLGVSFPAGFRIAGAGTRGYPQRSINLYLRGGYGRSSVTYPFFEGYGITEFKSLSLRNMGQDTNTRIKDAFLHMAVNGMNVDNMQTKFAAVYINGSYWGLYEFKENQNEDYLASKYGIDRDKVVMIRGNVNAVDEGSSADIKDMYNLAKRTANETSFEEYTSRADSAYFMDYIIAETFFYCSDSYNQKFAHTSDNALKWRPLYYDFDLSFSSTSGNWFGFFQKDEYIRGATESGLGLRITNTSLFNGFMRSNEWKQQFVKRYAEVLNTTLSTEHLLSVFDGLVNSIKDEMPRSIKKWLSPSSMNAWNNEIAALRERIINRRKYVIEQLKSFNSQISGGFKLSDEEMKALLPND